MGLVLTKEPEDVYAPTTAGGVPRGGDMGEALVLAREMVAGIRSNDSALITQDGRIDQVEADIDAVAVTAAGAVTTANAAVVTANSALAAATVGVVAPLVEMAAGQTVDLPAYTYNNGAGTITGNANGALATSYFDSVTNATEVGKRLWVNRHTFSNGWYVVTAKGDAGNPFVLTRLTEANTAAELGYSNASIAAGATWGGKRYQVQQKASDITLGTTALTFALVSDGSVAQAEVTTARQGEASLDANLTKIKATIPPVNHWPDPFAEQIEDNAFIRANLMGWVGSIVRPSAYKWLKTSIKGTGSGNASRRINIADLGAVAGDEWSFVAAGQFANTGNSVKLVTFTSANVQITANTLASGVGSGFQSRSGTVTLDANTAYVELRLEGANDKELLGVGAAPGKAAPSFVYPSRPDTSTPIRGIRKFNFDPFFRLASAGILTDDNGYKLISQHASATLVAAPAGSPYLTKAVFLPSGALVADFNMSIADLGPRIGESIYALVGMWANQSVAISFEVRTAAHAIVTSTTQIRDPSVGGAFGFGEWCMEIVPDAAVCVATNYVKVRVFTSGFAGANGAYILGWAIQKTRSRLVDDSAQDDRNKGKIAQAKSSHLTGKRLLILGDSTRDTMTVWAAKVAAITGATVLNAACGGTVLSTHSDSNYDKFSGSKLLEALATGVWTDQDAANVNLIGLGASNFTAQLALLKSFSIANDFGICFFYGQNDFGIPSAAIALGTTASTTRATWRGAINYCVNTILTAGAKLRLLFFTPHYRSRIISGDGLDSDTNANGLGLYLRDFADAEIEMCKLNHVPCFDGLRDYNLNKYNAATMLVDGLHLATAGQELLGEKDAEAILSKI